MTLTALVAVSMLGLVATPAAAEPGTGGGRANAGAPDAGPSHRAQAPGPQYTVNGIDVSSNDHTAQFPEIDWAAQVTAGTKFAYVKATEAQNYINPYFADDTADAKRAGLMVGAYTFGRPDRRDPVGDANFFIDNAAWVSDSRTLVPFLDMEWPWFTGVNACYDLTVAEMRDWVQRFLNQVKVRTGRNAMIYTAASWWNQCVGSTTQFSGYALDVATWDSTAPTLPQGWSTWTLWQWAPGDHSQRGVYDRNVFNGTLDEFRRLAGIDPLTSGPVTLNHGSEGLKVYANASGALVERIRRPGSGWSGWSNFGGDLAGQPAVFLHPQGSLEVYARRADGRLQQKFYSGGRWSGWNDLGGSLAGDPQVLYSSRYNSTEIYARGTDGKLKQKFYAGGWSGWNDLGGDFTGDPALLFNPTYGSTEIYTRGTNGHLMQKYYAGGWSGWNDLGGTLAGEPTIFLSPVYGTTELYARGTDGHLWQKYYSPSTGWAAWNNLGGTITGNPVLLYNPTFRSTEVYATANGHLVYTLYLPGGWYPWTDLGGTLGTTDPALLINPATGDTEAYAVETDGDLTGISYLRGQNRWSGWTNLMR